MARQAYRLPQEFSLNRFFISADSLTSLDTPYRSG